MEKKKSLLSETSKSKATFDESNPVTTPILFRINPIYISLLEGFRLYRRELDKLEQFVQLNATGFFKVLKKWDKHSKCHTKELFLSRAVQVQPVFHRDDIARLSDLAITSILELEASADGDNVSYGDTETTASDGMKDAVRLGHNRLTSSKSSSATNLELFDSDLVQLMTGENLELLGNWLAKLKDMDANPELAKNDVSKIFFQSISNKDIPDAALEQIYESGLVDLSISDEVTGRTVLSEAGISGRRYILDLVQRQEKTQDDLRNNNQVVEGPVIKCSTLLSQKDIYGRMPLHYACLHGHADLIEPFLDLGAPMDAVDQDNYSPLIFSVYHNHPSCVKILIIRGARTEPKSEQDYIPLNMACYNGFYKVTELLLERHPRLLPDAEGLYPQHLASRAGGSSLIPLLKNYGANLEQIDNLNGWTPLFYAASEGNYKTVVELLDAKVRVDAYDEKGLTPLYYAAWEGHVHCMRLLVANMNQDAEVEVDAEVGTAAATTTISKQMEDVTMHSGGIINRVNEDEINLDNTGDIDMIPDLTLPPPILPLRRYGHNFLGDAVYVQIFLEGLQSVTERQEYHEALEARGLLPAISNKSQSQYGNGNRGNASSSSSSNQPVRFYSDSHLPAVKMVMSSKSSDLIPRSVMLPLSDDDQVISFQVSRFDQFELTFELYPTFGTRIIAKSIALPNLFNLNSTSSGRCVIPLLDLRLQPIGEVGFSFQVIKPFMGKALAVSSFATYWKSTSQYDYKPSIVASLNDPDSVHPVHIGETISFITDTSLSGDYVRLPVQLTSDCVPVICPNWKLSLPIVVGSDLSLEIPVSKMTFEQFKLLGSKNRAQFNDETTRLAADRGLNQVHELLSTSFLSLAEVFECSQRGQLLPKSVHVNLDILYATAVEEKALFGDGCDVKDVNRYADCILQVIFDYARQVRRSAVEDYRENNIETNDINNKTVGISVNENQSAVFMAKGSGLEDGSTSIHNHHTHNQQQQQQQHEDEDQESADDVAGAMSLILSSCHPAMCAALNWKQPNYPVFFSLGGSLYWNTPTTEIAGTNKTDETVKFRSAHGLVVEEPEDRRCYSIKEATNFVVKNNLLGIILDIQLVKLIPSLIDSIRASGLMFIAQENYEESSESIKEEQSSTLFDAGIEGIRGDGVLSILHRDE